MNNEPVRATSSTSKIEEKKMLFDNNMTQFLQQPEKNMSMRHNMNEIEQKKNSNNKKKYMT